MNQTPPGRVTILKDYSEEEFILKNRRSIRGVLLKRV